jgi:hypothetical protein
MKRAIPLWGAYKGVAKHITPCLPGPAQLPGSFLHVFEWRTEVVPIRFLMEWIGME